MGREIGQVLSWVKLEKNPCTGSQKNHALLKGEKNILISRKSPPPPHFTLGIV